MGRRVTSADVAERAGVSRATVSYVLNDRPGQSIPEGTRRRVLAAAEELDYVPNHSARALRGKNAPVILLLTRALPFGRNLGDMTDTLTRLAGENGFTLVSLQAGSASSLELTIAHLQPQLIITVTARTEEEQEVLERRGIPHFDGLETYADLLGGERAARMQVEHMLGAGCSRIAYLGAEDPVLETFEAERRSGVEAALAEAGMPAPLEEALPRMLTPEQTAPLREVLRRWRAQSPPVDGVACYNDFWAAALLQAARADGVDVPGELAVIGLDDEPMAAFLDPPLTTIDYDAAGLATVLFARGMSRISPERTGDEAPSPQFRLVERGSV